MRRSKIFIAFAVLSATACADLSKCVKKKFDEYFGNFSGTESCPESCGTILSDPFGSLGDCAAGADACACAKVLPGVAGYIESCCDSLGGFMEAACSFALHGMSKQLDIMLLDACDSDEIGGADQYTMLLSKTRDNVLEGAVAVLEGLRAGAEQHVGSGATALLAEDLGASAARDYVSRHAKGQQCTQMVDAMEAEQHALSESDPDKDMDVPDLRAAVQHLASNSERILGKAAPGLKNKLHTAMVTAWSVEGPGLDADGACELILRHLDDDDDDHDIHDDRN
eukprot:CAMPEP_0179061224 /NCGR_PEP_ID=MMETSP0796-20121207/26282_1 /TAXON_ID=73915 /ORGANISM="Pyrodinium bahamense, Strain pbaha01" /LENGTH=281 /DNA_ID=CAMNT_0020758053 /DNA_START=73 /DNA_END=918 /DNA_ORIENTATION=+